MKNAVILCSTNNLQQDSPEDIVDSIIEIGHCFKKQHHHINIFICGLLPRDEWASINCVYVIETNKILKVKCSLNKFFLIDQDTYWTQLNGCLNSAMFYLDKLNLVEKGNLVLAKSICSSMEYSHRIITRNEFKTSYKLATVFQLNNTDFPVLSSKYVCKAVSGCTKVPSIKFISNVVAKSLRKFVCIRKFVSVPMFAQSICSPSYRVVKRCDFDLVNKVNINTRCSVSVCRKVGKSVFVSVSTNVFHTSAPDVSKSVLSVSAVSLIPAPTLTVHPVMFLHGRNVLVSVNATCRVCNVSPYIHLSVNTSTLLVNYVSYNVHHVQGPKCVSFKSKVSVTSNFKYVSLSPLYTIFVAILFNTFSFTQSAKAIVVCIIFSIIAPFLLVYIRFYTKNGGMLIYYIGQYKLFFACFLDYLYICESLKIAWLINHTKFASTFKIFVLAALYLIKCFGTQAFLTKFRLCLRNFKLCKKCNLLLGLQVHLLLSTGFLMYYFFRFIALVLTNTLSFVLVFFGAFTKYKSLALLLILPAAVCIMREPP